MPMRITAHRAVELLRNHGMGSTPNQMEGLLETVEPRVDDAVLVIHEHPYDRHDHGRHHHGHEDPGAEEVLEQQAPFEQDGEP